MITSKSVLNIVELMELPTISSNDSPEAILTYIKQHLRDVYGATGNIKEIKLVLKDLIANASNKIIKEKLLNILRNLS
jgi:hypothetical protein